MASTAPVIQVEVSTSTLNANDHLVDYPDTTTLMGTQHVTHVMLYIFKGSDETAEYCGQFEEVKWKEHFTANGGMLPIHSARMNHRLKTQLERNTPYQFLAVGTNDEGHETFNVPLNPSAEGQKGTTLTEALGKLKETATVQKIRRSEILLRESRSVVVWRAWPDGSKMCLPKWQHPLRRESLTEDCPSCALRSTRHKTRYYP